MAVRTLNLWLVAAAIPARSVLRYPDGAFESRYPLHIDECALPGQQLGPNSRACLGRLRKHLLEDADCNRVICDNIATSTPIEVYANQTDWIPFKNLCGHLQELFLGVFDLGVKMVGMEMTEKDIRDLKTLSQVFASSEGVAPPDVDEMPVYANSTRAVLRRHASAAMDILLQVEQSDSIHADRLLDAAAALARRLQLLIENVSVTLLLNFHIAQLDHNGRAAGRNYLHELYGNVESVRVVFHEIPGKRWDALTHLLDTLGVSERPVTMAEVGVEAANTSQRLLERNQLLSYIGVDPYVNNDGLHADVTHRLSFFREAGRFSLHRNTSLNASLDVADRSLDIVFLDARHDFQAVVDDVRAWKPKLRPGGILSGHDFSWMFPTVAMAVYQETFDAPDRTVNLAPDGVWWLHL
mmetsp:Transcript_35375/g.65877  ORF Transcript_35375/g.65877 Transcript_35375/m.65877 type:complete len:411 (+) Transcript_35375:64-1296(+)